MLKAQSFEANTFNKTQISRHIRLVFDITLYLYGLENSNSNDFYT